MTKHKRTRALTRAECMEVDKRTGITPLRLCRDPACVLPHEHEAHDKVYDIAAHLDRVRAILCERGTTRDKPGGERSMARCVRIYNAMTGRDLTAADGWRFMLALKLARMSTGKYKADDYDDLSGYSALLAEEARAESAARAELLPCGPNCDPERGLHGNCARG
jgi:hypothetical protein